MPKSDGWRILRGCFTAKTLRRGGNAVHPISRIIPRVNYFGVENVIAPETKFPGGNKFFLILAIKIYSS
jgi:hypothetical protein